MNEHELKILKAVLAGYNTYGWDAWKEDSAISIPGIGHVVCISRYIPQEDSGLPGSLVFRVSTVTDTEFFKKTAYFDSYDGMKWASGDFRKVFPVTKTVYEYE